jgi:hypothetical protein
VLVMYEIILFLLEFPARFLQIRARKGEHGSSSAIFRNFHARGLLSRPGRRAQVNV